MKVNTLDCFYKSHFHRSYDDFSNLNVREMEGGEIRMLNISAGRICIYKVTSISITSKITSTLSFKFRCPMREQVKKWLLAETDLEWDQTMQVQLLLT